MQLPQHGYVKGDTEVTSFNLPKFLSRFLKKYGKGGAKSKNLRRLLQTKCPELRITEDLEAVLKDNVSKLVTVMFCKEFGWKFEDLMKRNMELYPAEES